MQDTKLSLRPISLPLRCLRRGLWGLLLSLLVLVASSDAAENPLAGKRPNIIVILTDDQGYGDVSAHGNPILKTPELDKLHAASRRFTDFRVSPTCAPTRCSLMTGRHEFRSGVTHTIFERERMSLKATTFVQLLQKSGYHTGIFGKWHLGDEPERWPSKRGFDEMFIHGAGGIGQKFPGTCADAPNNSYFDPWILHNGTFEKTSGYCTDVFFSQAIKWIEQQKESKEPFLAWISTNAPHDPLNCPLEWVAPYEGKVPPNIAKFFGMIANIDHNLGILRGKLHDWGIENNTLLVFINDNGTATGDPIFNAGMAGKKVTPDNGGTRAISFWHWPNGIKPGDCDKLTAHIDMFPTMLELAGVSIPENLQGKLDGFSLVPLLADPNSPWHDDRILFTHVGRWKEGKPPVKLGACSVRQRELLAVHRPKGWELYDLKKDPGEKNNLAAEKPEALASMIKAFDSWWEEVLPALENEDAIHTAPAISPYHELFAKQQAGK